jgi:hypothetical protein
LKTKFRKKLVEEPEIGTNRPYLIDSIKISTIPKLIRTSEIKALYLQNGLSAGQIAEKYGVSKSFVLATIHRSGLTTSKAGRSTDPANYRNNSPPYGYLVRDGRLAPNKSELKICRLVVELRGRRGLSTTQVARELEKQNFKNRKGRTVWNSNTILNIFERWKNKI